MASYPVGARMAFVASTRRLEAFRQPRVLLRARSQQAVRTSGERVREPPLGSVSHPGHISVGSNQNGGGSSDASSPAEPRARPPDGAGFRVRFVQPLGRSLISA